MSRQSQDLYTSVQTAHNKIDKLDKRISKLEGGIVASADALADLEYRHLKRITALEGDGEDNAEVIQDHQLRLTDLETLHYRGKYPARHNYIEPVHNEPKHTCGECVRPFWNEAYGNGWCFGSAGKGQPVDRDDEACGDFMGAK